MALDPGLLAPALANPQLALQELDRLDAEERLRDFIPLVWEVLEPARPLIWGWPVDAICEHLEAVTAGQIRRLLINVPPGFMKSLTTDVLWPAWEWGPRNLPHLRYVCASYSEALTVRDNRRTRNIVLSQAYQEMWGDRFRLVSDQNAKIRFDTDKTGFKLATSVGGVGTGERGDRFVIDDPHNVKTVESEATRNSTLHWFAEVVPTRLNDPDKSAIVVIMQRTHDQDVSGLILSEGLGYEHLCLPMEYEARHRCMTAVPREGVEPELVFRVKHEDEPIPRWVPRESLEAPEGAEPSASQERVEPPASQERVEPPASQERVRWLWPQDRRTEEGELLWEARFSRRHLEEDLKPALRSWGGSYAEAGQLQQRPAPRGGGLFKRHNWQYVDPHEVPQGGRVVRGWDLAGTDDGRAAYTAGVRMRKVRGALYIEDVRRDQKSPAGVEKMLLDTAREDGHGTWISIPQDPGQSGKSQRRALAAMLDGYRVHSSQESGSKEDRAIPLVAQQESGNVYLVRGPWNAAFVAEAALFPAGRFKDQIDAASRAHAFLTSSRDSGPPKGARMIQ